MNGPLRVSFVVAALSILALSAAPAEAARCRPCEVAHERCSTNCFGLDRADIGGCFVACDNEAALCSCDEAVTLSSEDFVARFGSPATTQLAGGACNWAPPCGTEYGSCGSWSSYVDCDAPRCVRRIAGCGPCGPEDPCLGPGLQQTVERYRVCLNQQGQHCTEYQHAFGTLQCDC